ncbi:MAG: TolC family protein [Bdellovibrio sp.]|nr:TolC family protein [Bdellovibrio sp.]
MNSVKPLIIILCFFVSKMVLAETTPLHLNPEILRKYILEENSSILLGMNAVRQAKHRVSIARAQLLPNLNIGTVISSGPTFALAAVEMLLSFLMPAKWFNVGVSKNLFEAEKISYYLLQLNQYASAFALYQTIRGDIALRDVLYNHYQDLSLITSVLARQYSLGMISLENLAHATSQTKMAELRVSQMDQLLAEETAAVRNLIGASLDREIIFDEFEVAPSAAEDETIEVVAAEAFALSPENTQLDFLMKASKFGKWKQLFGFIGGATLGSRMSSASSSGVSFANMTSNVSINLGLEMIPGYSLSNDNIEQIKLQKLALFHDLTQIIEGSLKAVAQVKDQLELASLAESNMKKVYEIKKTKYDLGMISIMTLLQTRFQVTESRAAKIKAQVELDNLRISLHRQMLTDQFQEIHGCHAQMPVDQKKTAFVRWLLKLFRHIRLDVDKLCRPTV